MFTPISAILSEIDVTLRKLREAPYYEETLQTVRRHAQRLAGIVEALLKLSHAEAIGHIERKKVDASEVARDLIEHFRASAEARSVQLPCDLASDVPAAVDPAHLEAVLENLLDNAIKYTPPGGTVTVSTYVEGREAVLRITDTGVGFTEEEAARLFDRFYRSVAHPVQQVRGSGLGLSIAKAVVDVYGGHITAQSPGRSLGSTFEVRLPLAELEGGVLKPVR